MKFRIIGDIHGRQSWKELVDPFDMNIFVGDYFDPYTDISYEELKDNFMDILAFKMRFRNNVILLLGNHDLHYWWYTGTSGTSRFIQKHAKEIHELFMEFKDEFQIAYAIGDQYLVTHAGVSEDWYKNRIGEQIKKTPKVLADSINGMLEHDRKNCFLFSLNSNYGDYYGNSPQQSCVWIRPQSLVLHNVFEDLGYNQIVGHTQVMQEICSECNTEGGEQIYFVDILGIKPDCLLVYLDNDKWVALPLSEYLKNDGPTN